MHNAQCTTHTVAIHYDIPVSPVRQQEQSDDGDGVKILRAERGTLAVCVAPLHREGRGRIILTRSDGGGAVVNEERRAIFYMKGVFSLAIPAFGFGPEKSASF